MAAATASLPLHCSICPKKPNFSDVSHLLTHIASKGHLAHYYRIKVRSGKDLNARTVIDAYDEWYTHYGVERLMSDRMHQKDRKRPHQRAAASEASIETETHIKSSTLDPLLFSLNDNEPWLHPVNATTSYPSCHPDEESLSPLSAKVQKPPTAIWRTRRPKSVVCIISDLPSNPYSPLQGFKPGNGVAPQAQMRSDFMSTFVEAEEEEEDDTSEATRLKGVFWPGMDIFDAATPGTKRKRNQKKDTSVAVQLERRSTHVEPTEMIFTPLGSFKKERLISGHANFDSSPDKLSPPTPKPKKRQAGRPPLGKKDTNARLGSRVASTTSFPGYGPVDNRRDKSGNSRPSKTQERNFEVFRDDSHHVLDTATSTRLFTSGFRPATQLGASSNRSAPSTLVDINTGAMYHNNQFTETLEPLQSTFYGVPYCAPGYFPHSNFNFAGLYSRLQTHLSNPGCDSGERITKVEDSEDAHTLSAGSDD